ncbi:hypothetical protein BTN49_3146 [Candidatus Enterovibrio escicola]|uniref:Uncharacterized protein n=1 Tax=Candidatus Enterovibrio escicola TaxID=1927127 RepID=A0A2A5SZH1_9GAMM|nr:hypothetical protein BTN49_3146 [Candidatus Enterovibrio escacola]
MKSSFMGLMLLGNVVPPRQLHDKTEESHRQLLCRHCLT